MADRHRYAERMFPAPVDPRTPEAVAGARFDALGTGPRAYSHPDDAAHAEAVAARPRAAVVSAMGTITSQFWK